MTRAAQQSAAFEAGRVLLPGRRNGSPSSNGRHDDQIDSMMRFLRWAAERARYEVPIVSPIIITIPRTQEWSLVKIGRMSVSIATVLNRAG
jgi:hypothetical protein